jgi:hypothetical protein
MMSLILIVPVAVYLVMRSRLWNLLRSLPDSNDDLVYY